ncbi:SWI/SNF complex subunit SWI3C isoform X1 [Iris pallida]|uniref:SWI/SNF complex subunit SWI3C isoform X1 n=1 Tax=Iris pallida TaxID=29817 RepID=A0AAX6FU81_IRIPA|nr:SWI/SNF complex subunit SWI3C isoform X1 [Iris pallida]
MSPASPSLPSSDSRPKWRKRKRRQKPQDEEEEDEEEEEEAEEEQRRGREPSPPPNNSDPGLESVSDPGYRVSDFPPAVRRNVARPHPSVLALVASERFATVARPLPALENVSHGQLQALSAVPADHLTDQDKGSATYVCTPPALMEGKGVVKRFGDGRLLLVPMHSDWFLPTSVYRLERQVVPHFFSGKSTGHTPEKYIALRNSIVSRYLENPGRRLSFGDCQGLVSSSELYDLSRMVRFLDHWGIINYLAASSVHRGLRMAGSLIKEEGNGELIVQTAPLRSIDSLILFDRPKCSIRQEDIALLASSSSGPKDSGRAADDLDNKIRERLSEHACSYCSRPLPRLHYQSRKEVDTILCSECFHDAKFITAHSSIDFQRVDSRKDTLDLDGDSWTDQETLMLLEALEKYS